jgi:hypothetical protein
LSGGAHKVVVASFEDTAGIRCIDIVRFGASWSWAECRRDPEDGHGWRPTGTKAEGFSSQRAATEGAARDFTWVETD